MDGPSIFSRVDNTPFIIPVLYSGTKCVRLYFVEQLRGVYKKDIFESAVSVTIRFETNGVFFTISAILIALTFFS